MTPPAVAILVPVLNRPHQIERMMVDVEESLESPYRLLFVADAADGYELRALRRLQADHIVVPRPRRSYACKINDGVRATDERLIFMAADDVHFHPGWLEAAWELIRTRPDVEVVGTNDGGVNPRVAAGDASVHTLLTRTYALRGTIDNPGVVLHEGYPHEYVDDEFVGTARFRGAYAHAHASVVEHLHPYTKLVPVDNTYRRGWAGRARGKRVIEARRHLWASPST